MTLYTHGDRQTDKYALESLEFTLHPCTKSLIDSSFGLIITNMFYAAINLFAAIHLFLGELLNFSPFRRVRPVKKNA